MDLQQQYEKLLRYCYMRTKDRFLAEDITQETFLRFWQSHSYEDTGKELAYLYTIARNLCIDNFRKPATESIQNHYDNLATEVFNPAEQLEHLEIENALGQLPEEMQEMIVLRYINELTVSDIGKIMNMSRYAVHRRIKDGLRSLKKILGEGEVL